MDRKGFLKLTTGVLLAPYLAKIPAASKPPYELVSSAVGTGSTITASTPGVFRAGDIIRSVHTGEALRVTRIDGKTMDVQRLLSP